MYYPIKNLVFLLAVTLPVIAQAVVSIKVNDKNISRVDKYDVVTPGGFLKEVKSDNPGVGSSLKLKEKNKDGSLVFYAISDRGLNFEGPNSTQGETVKLFAVDDFHPFISEIKLVPKRSAVVEKIVKLDATGLPVSQERSQARVELPLDMNFNRLQYDDNGIDSEAIAVDKDGNFWVADEYMPSLVKISPQGEIIKRIDYSNGMPEILKYRLENRGIEALTITPSGKLVFALESVLNIEGKTAKTALFIRLVEFDPLTHMTKTYAYKYDQGIYKSNDLVKIGDIVAIDEGRFLIIEQGKTEKGMRNTVQLIDINKATDISEVRLPNGQELEFANETELKVIKVIEKKFIADLRKFGWPFQKMEGIAYIDPHHFAVINDNDFGYDIDYIGATCKCQHNYAIDIANKKLLFKNQPTDVKLDMKETKQATQLWVIETKKPMV